MELLDRILATDMVERALDRLHQEHGSAEGWSLVAFDTRGEAGRVMFERSVPAGSSMPPVFAGVYRIAELEKLLHSVTSGPTATTSRRPRPIGCTSARNVGTTPDGNLVEFTPRAEN